LQLHNFYKNRLYIFFRSIDLYQLSYVIYALKYVNYTSYVNYIRYDGKKNK